MIIIIDGPDLSGKTYAVERIAKKLNSGFILKNTFKPRTLEDSPKIYKQYWDILNIISDYEQSDNIVILDRFFPSQSVYSYLRGEDEFEHPEVQALDTFCEAVEVLYIYLDTPLQTLLNRYDERGDEHIKKEMLIKLKERYDNFYEKTEMKKVKLNTMSLGWLDEINNRILEHKELSDKTKVFGGEK